MSLWIDFINEKAVLATFILGTLIVLLSKQLSRRSIVDKPIKVHDGQFTVIRLLEFEVNTFCRVPSPNTITFFTGKVCPETFCNKVNDVIKANPWLLGRIVNSQELGQMALKFRTSFDSSISHESFLFVKNPDLYRNMPFDVLSSHCQKYFVPTANKSVDKDIPVFRIVLFEIKPDEEYAMLMSMSHMIADGHTYYSIYAMLDLNTNSRSLIVERNHEFIPLVRKALGSDLLDWFTKPGLSLAVLRTMFFQKKSSVSGFKSSAAAIARIKSDHTCKNISLQDSKTGGEVKEYGRVPFLSTNDILTSWFFRTCGSNVCLMLVNFRDRLKGITSDHAGNYERSLLYYNGDGYEPHLIRQSIIPSCEGKFGSRTGYLPSVLETAFGRVALVTNWSTFYKDICITTANNVAAQNIFHRPTSVLDNAIITDICIIFKCNADTTAVSCNCRSADIPQLFHSGNEDCSLLETKLF